MTTIARTYVIPQTPLYQWVYGRYSRYGLVAGLIVALFIQPLHQVFADEVINATAPSSNATSTDTTLSEVDETDTTYPESDDGATDGLVDSSGTTTELLSDEVQEVLGSDELDSNTSTSTDEQSVVVESEDGVMDTATATSAVSTTTSAEALADDTVSTSTTEQSPTITLDTGSTASTSSTSSSAVTDLSPTQSTAESGTSSAMSDSEAVAGAATSTEYIDMNDEFDPGQTTITNRTNRHQFSEDQCVSMGNGSYYCHENVAEGVGESDTDVVYAALSQSGYQDIYLRTMQGTRNITNSSYEDTAPQYDQQTETVVWHRDVDGRYQIMSYDIRSQTIEQLTDTRVNDMQPSRFNQYTVWQRWVNGYWQIVLHDGEEEKILTDNTVHDVGPSVRGETVIWNTTTATGERQLAVYSIETELVSYISGSESGRVSNPRFVLVYDTKLPSGDIVTQGYDPETGEVQPLSAVPTEPLPDIPSPDPVGETRALAQPKTDSLGEEVVEDDAETATGSVTTTASTTVSGSAQATTTNYTLDLASSTATTTEELSEYDLVVPPATASSTTATTTSTTTGNGAE